MLRGKGKKMNEYEKQANDFLSKTGTTFTVKLLGNFPYFDDDKESRDVYQVTLTRGKETYSFKFGQSLANSAPAMEEKRKKHLERKGRNIVFKKFNPELFPKIPTPYDVLSCVQKYDIGTFTDFCNEFGYDTDSRKAEKTYFAVQEEWKGINNLFADVMEELQEIQ